MVEGSRALGAPVVTPILALEYGPVGADSDEAIAAEGDSRPKIATGPHDEIYVTWTKPFAKPYTGEIRFARVKIPPSLPRLFAVERDKFLTPMEAKEFGLIDEVVETRPTREDERGFRT